MIMITPNFSLKEIEHSTTGTRLGIENKLPESGLPFAQELFQTIMQPLRDQVGPIRVLSGYRCEELNRAVGGSPKSQHVYGPDRGAACDFVSATGELSNMDLARMVLKLGLPFDQLILEYFGSRTGGWIHVSQNKNSCNNRK